MKHHSWNDPHVIRAWKSILKALYFTLFVFIFLFVIFHIAGTLYLSSIASKSSDAFHTGIAHDLAYLKEQGDAVAKNDLLQEYVISRDSQKLIELTKKEVATRGIGLMGVADSNGVLLSRTYSKGNLGNNIFLVNPVGRVLAKGQSAESVEAPVGFEPNQIFLNTGRPIMRDGKMIGALTANYLTDDAYATRFQDTYLPQGVKVVFYNKAGGVYGDGFLDPETQKLINSYFSPGSEWIQNGNSGKTVSFTNGNYYLVQNIIFPGLEKSPGGALIFIPRRNFSDTANVITVLFTVITFILLTLRHHLRSHGEERGWRYYTLLLSTTILIIVLAIFALYIQNTGYLKLKRIPYALYNSTIRLQPDFGIYDINSEQHFSVIVDTGDEVINGVGLAISFDPKMVKVKELNTDNSVCSYVIENVIDQKTGKIKFSCILVKSNAGKGSLNIADVVLVPKNTGTFTLSFDKETQVTANDGLGTDVLRMSQTGSYRVDNFAEHLFSNIPDKSGRTFIVFSPTHPNEARWYNSDTAHFVWLGKPDSVYAYEFDSYPNTIPTKKYTIQGNSIDIPTPSDGVFYFHLQLASGGPVVNYKIQVDKTPPIISAINLSSSNVVEGDVVRFSFEAKDAGSGIQHNYYADLGNHLFLPIGSELFVPFLDVGDQKLILRVYDNAGNYSEESQIVHVEAKAE